MKARTIGQVIAGEAVSGTPEERWNDMLGIASVIANRAQALGVTPQEVIANTNEFNAYNRVMPAGTPNLVDMANEAMNYVEANGPVNNATFYATPAAVDNLPDGLVSETETTGHQYFSDPQNRAIGTSLGYVTPNSFSYAANPQNVPTPDQPGLMAATGEIGPGWSINGVAPALGPTVEGWSATAAANPMTAPMNSVTASGSLQANPGMLASAIANPIAAQQPATAPQDSFGDLAAAGPFGGQYASPQSRMGLATPGISQADIDRALAGPTEGMDPSFTAGLMSSQNPVVPTAVETTSYTPEGTPPTPSLGSFPDAMAAQRMPATGIYSPEHLAMQRSMSVPALDAAAAVNVQQPTGALSTAMATPNFTQALNPSVPGLSVPSVDVSNAYAQPTATTPAEQAISDITSQAPADLGSFAAAMSAQRAVPGYHISDLDGVTMVKDTVVPTAPALDSVQVAEQPSIADPVSTPAVTQQAQQQVQTAAATQTQPAAQNKGMLSGALNPGTAMGGIAGALAAGPLGGIIGAIIGNQIAKNGLPSASSNTTLAGGYLGAGPSAAYGVYGGAPAGSYATASDGSTVTSQANGDVTRTNTYGVTDTANSYGGYAADWSGDDDDDAA